MPISRNRQVVVHVNWEDLYGPMPYFKDDPDHQEIPRHTIKVDESMAIRWKRTRKRYEQMVKELEDMVER